LLGSLGGASDTISTPCVCRHGRRGRRGGHRRPESIGPTASIAPAPCALAERLLRRTPAVVQRFSRCGTARYPHWIGAKENASQTVSKSAAGFDNRQQTRQTNAADCASLRRRRANLRPNFPLCQHRVRHFLRPRWPWVRLSRVRVGHHWTLWVFGYLGLSEQSQDITFHAGHSINNGPNKQNRALNERRTQ